MDLSILLIAISLTVACIFFMLARRISSLERKETILMHELNAKIDDCITRSICNNDDIHRINKKIKDIEIKENKKDVTIMLSKNHIQYKIKDFNDGKLTINIYDENLPIELFEELGEMYKYKILSMDNNSGYFTIIIHIDGRG